MNRLNLKLAQANRRSFRVRSRFSGTTKRPRLTVKISNKHITAQIIDDSVAKTLVYVSTAKWPQTKKQTMLEKAAVVGEQIASLAKKAKIQKVVFDRGAKLYHGRVKALAEAARTAGLEL